MKVIHEGNEIATVPDHMSIGDTLIINDSVFEIQTKTLDCDNNDLYCKVKSYEHTATVCEILEKIYESNYFKTGGLNTNEIEMNPRLIVLMSLLPILIDEEHLMRNVAEYKNNIIRRWGEYNIEWLDIFKDNPISKTSNLNKIKSIATKLYENAKISRIIWPDGIK